jgi:hypothetical protein
MAVMLVMPPVSKGGEISTRSARTRSRPRDRGLDAELQGSSGRRLRRAARIRAWLAAMARVTAGGQEIEPVSLARPARGTIGRHESRSHGAAPLEAPARWVAEPAAGRTLAGAASCRSFRPLGTINCAATSAMLAATTAPFRDLFLGRDTKVICNQLQKTGVGPVPSGSRGEDWTECARQAGDGSSGKLRAKLPGEFEVLGCFLAAVHHDVERDVLTFGQCRQSGAFDGGNVDEHILAAVAPRDKALSLRGIEPFDNALVHRRFILS